MKKLLLSVSKAKDLGEGIIEAVVATESEDRHGEVLEMKGLDTRKYMDNPVVLWAHDYSKPPVGRTLSLKKVGDKLVAKIKFAIDEDSFAHKIYKLYKGGYMRAFSIGFIPLDIDQNRYTKAEMLEHSCVPVPANAEALSLAVSKGLIDESDLSKLLIKEKNMKLKEILAKKPSDLSAEELAFLIEKKEELTDAQKIVFKDVLPEQEEEESEDNSDDESKNDKVKNLENKIDKLSDALDGMVERKSINTNKLLRKSNKDLPKEEKLKLWVKGLVTKDYRDYLDSVDKAEAMNTSDDSQIIPPVEFIAEVSRLEEEYGVAARYANVRRTSNAGLKGIKGGDDLEFVKTAELGLKSKQETSYSNYNLTHLEYTGIVPVSDTLLEDSAINLWNDLTQRFARAAAKREDELVFIENDTDDDVYGIIQASGTAQVSVGSDFSDFDSTNGADKLNEMMYEVPTPSMTNGRYYLHRTMLGRIQRMRTTDGNSVWAPGIDGGANGTIWGMPYTLVEVMPAVSEITTGDPFLIFGDLSNTTLSIRVPMETKFFDQGVITDAAGNVLLNLMQQDAQAIRARLRMNQVHVHAEAYSVLVAGSLS